MPTVNGVLGPIDVDELGFTLMHEHVLIANWAMRRCYPGYLDVDAHVAHASHEVGTALERGVRTMVDLTPVNLGRDIDVIRRVAERSGAQIIAATGFYRLTRSILRTPEEGADPSVWLAVSDAARHSTGGFWMDRRAQATHWLPWTRESEGDREHLWALCCRLAQLGDVD